MSNPFVSTKAPKRGESRIVTDREIGEKRAKEIIGRSKAERADNVRDIYNNAQQPMAVFAQQYRKDARAPSTVIPFTTAVTVTGQTEAGDMMLSTYMASATAFISQQQRSLRYATNCVFVERGNATDIFGIVGQWHAFEAQSLYRTRFRNVGELKVPSSIVTAVREWTRGRDVAWLMLPSLMATKAAMRLREKAELMAELEAEIYEAIGRGDEPDPRVVRRYNAVKIGIGNEWLFLGYQGATEIEREPSLEAIEAAAQDKTVIIDQR